MFTGIVEELGEVMALDLDGDSARLRVRAPVVSADATHGGSIAVKQGIDADLLEQRANFLRPDSSVVVVVLTDENDCSIVDGGYGWLAGHQGPGGEYVLPRATAA